MSLLVLCYHWQVRHLVIGIYSQNLSITFIVQNGVFAKRHWFDASVLLSERTAVFTGKIVFINQLYNFHRVIFFREIAY